jgi:hypothetical protein
MVMDLNKMRAMVKVLMSSGATAVFVGVAIMLHGELNFGDAVLIAGIVLFISGVVLLARMPTGDSDAG